VASFLVATLGLGLYAATQQSSLSTRFQAAESTFSRPDDVVLWLSLQYGGDNCEPTYVDPVLVPGPPEKSRLRRFSLLELEVLDEEGHSASRKRLPTAHYLELRPEALVRIDCSVFTGWEVHLTRSPWYYVLQKGRYRARGVLWLRTRSFAEEHPVFLEGFVRWLGRQPVEEFDATSLLGQGRLELDDVSFEILQDQ